MKNQKTCIILISLFFIAVLTTGCVNNSGKTDLQQVSPIPTAIPATPVRESGCDYCFIQEVHPDFIKNATIVHLTSEDLKDYPLYGDVIESGKKNSRDWINGHRTISDFHDCQQQIGAFWNLSCRHISYPECTSKEVPVIYEYDGRYHDVSCLPGFDGGVMTRPSA